MLPLPESQQAEDYPKDMAARVTIAADAALGVRRGRVWTAQGAASGLAFVVGDLPEIVEQEIDGDPVPVDVQLPVTINGRIFPRQNVDVWAFPLHKGQTVACEVCAARLGSPLDSYLEVLGPDGRRHRRERRRLRRRLVRPLHGARRRQVRRPHPRRQRPRRPRLRLSLNADVRPDHRARLPARRPARRGDALHAVRPGRPGRSGGGEAARRRPARFRLALHRRRRQGGEPGAARPGRPAGNRRDGAERPAGPGEHGVRAVRAERPHRQAGRRGFLEFSGEERRIDRAGAAGAAARLAAARRADRVRRAGQGTGSGRIVGDAARSGADVHAAGRRRLPRPRRRPLPHARRAGIRLPPPPGAARPRLPAATGGRRADAAARRPGQAEDHGRTPRRLQRPDRPDHRRTSDRREGGERRHPRGAERRGNRLHGRRDGGHST